MLSQPQVQRYSTESGLRDIMIAEKEVVLTFLLQLLSERGILNLLAFKGGTCLRKMLVGTFALLLEYGQVMTLSSTSSQGSLDLLALKEDSLDFIEFKKKGASMQPHERRIRSLVE